MIITIDTTQPLSEGDAAVIALLIGENGSEPKAEAPKAEAPAARTTRQPRKAAAPAATPASVEEPEEDVEESTGPTVDDAIARATELMQAGKTSDVKLALAEVGAKRVSELKDGQISAFLSAVEDL